MIKMQSMPSRKVELATNLAARMEWEQAVADEYLASQDAGRRRVSQKEDPALSDARARQDAARELMAESMFVFTLSAIPRTKYRLLVAEHPPREGDVGEQQVNVATFGDALIKACILRVEDHAGRPVDFDPAVEWEPLADGMTDAQWTDFYRTAVDLNVGAHSVPPKRATS